MEDPIQSIAWIVSVCFLPGFHLTVVAYLAFHRQWPACKRVLVIGVNYPGRLASIILAGERRNVFGLLSSVFLLFNLHAR